MTTFKMNFWIFLIGLITLAVIGVMAYTGLGILGIVGDKTGPTTEIDGMVLIKTSGDPGGRVTVVDETNRDSPDLTVSDRDLFNSLQLYKRYHFTLNKKEEIIKAEPL